MQKSLIKKYCLESSTESWVIGNYILPKIVSGKDIEKHRALALLTKSSYEASFIYDTEILTGKAVTRKSLYSYYREFPVPIVNKELWESLAPGNEGDYFMLDFFFYEAGFIVEIDSPYHDSKKEYDAARDQYLLHQHGLKTLRFYEYGKEKDIRVEYQASFRGVMKKAYWTRTKGSRRPGPVILDFSDMVVDNYIRSNKESLLLIDSLIRYLGLPEFLERSEIELSPGDLMKIWPARFKKAGGKYNPDDMFLNLTQKVASLIYGVMVILKP